MVLFAEQRVPVEEIGNKFHNFLTEAKHEERFGKRENIVIGIPHPNRSTHLPPSDLSNLFTDKYIDYVERFSSLNTRKGNLYSERMSTRTDISGLAVDEGHKLRDMARSITTIHFDINKNKNVTYEQMGNMTRQCIRNNDFDTNENYLPVTSKFHYVFNLAMATIFPEHNPAPNSNARPILKNVNSKKERVYYK